MIIVVSLVCWLHEVSKERQSLQRDVSEIKKMLAEERQSLQRDVSEIKKMLAEERQSLQRDVSEIKKMLAEAQGANSEIKNALSQVQRANSKMKDDLALLNDAVRSAISKIETLMEQNDRFSNGTSLQVVCQEDTSLLHTTLTIICAIVGSMTPPIGKLCATIVDGGANILRMFS